VSGAGALLGYYRSGGSAPDGNEDLEWNLPALGILLGLVLHVPAGLVWWLVA
jgi:hypothetical protein